MKMTQKTLGLSVVALAAALFATASVADNMGRGMGPEMGFASADANKDGKITQAEFDAWKANRVTGLDADKDGLLTASELSAGALAQMTARAETMATRMIERHDANADGKLSAEELASGPTPGFAMLDANGDGAIDQAELQARHGGHEGQKGRRGHGGGHGKGHGEDMPPAGN